MTAVTLELTVLWMILTMVIGLLANILVSKLYPTHHGKKEETYATFDPNVVTVILLAGFLLYVLVFVLRYISGVPFETDPDLFFYVFTIGLSVIGAFFGAVITSRWLYPTQISDPQLEEESTYRSRKKKNTQGRPYLVIASGAILLLAVAILIFFFVNLPKVDLHDSFKQRGIKELKASVPLQQDALQILLDIDNATTIDDVFSWRQGEIKDSISVARLHAMKAQNLFIDALRYARTSNETLIAALYIEASVLSNEAAISGTNAVILLEEAIKAGNNEELELKAIIQERSLFAQYLNETNNLISKANNLEERELISNSSSQNPPDNQSNMSVDRTKQGDLFKRFEELQQSINF